MSLPLGLPDLSRLPGHIADAITGRYQRAANIVALYADSFWHRMQF